MQVANGVVRPVSKETLTKYKQVIEDPLLRETWLKAMCRELGRLAQGYDDVEGINTIIFLDLDEMKNEINNAIGSTLSKYFK